MDNLCYTLDMLLKSWREIAQNEQLGRYSTSRKRYDSQEKEPKNAPNVKDFKKQAINTTDVAFYYRRRGRMELRR